jgi:hypothetical protein|tara:strand:- start:6 stop:482 length:477 start_codon:yes stop_codon:yes gene_type:complete
MAFSLDASKFLEEANEFAVPTRGNNLRRGQAYYSSTQAPGSMVTPLTPMIDMGGTNTLGTAADKENALGMRFAGDALSAYANKEAAEELAKAERAAARAKSRGSMFGSILGTLGTLGGAAILACDERFKEDMAPLQVSEVNDDLAAMAFAVQEIRGHS